MLTLNRLLFALAFLGGSAAVQAADGYSNLVVGRPGEGFNKSGSGLKTAEYHYYAPVTTLASGTHNGVQVSQAALHGRFDPRQTSNYIF